MTYTINISDNVVNGEGSSLVGAVFVDGSPTGAGRTQAALEVVARSIGPFEPVSLADPNGFDRALTRLDEATAVVFGAPVYRAEPASPLKQLLDLIPRDRDGESPLAAKPVAIVLTGASLHHFLALDGLRSVLAGFFAAHVIPPGLYVPREAWNERNELLEPYATYAAHQGRALVELAQALTPGSALASVRPQA